MKCRNCKYVKEPRRLGYDRMVGKEWECHFGAVRRKVKPDDSCCFAEKPK